MRNAPTIWGEEKYTEINTDSHIMDNEKCEKSTFRYNMTKDNFQKANSIVCCQEQKQLMEGIDSEKSEKSIIRWNLVMSSSQERSVTLFNKGSYGLSDENDSKESINRTSEAECKQDLKENSKQTIEISEVQYRDSENSINWTQRSDKKQQD